MAGRIQADKAFQPEDPAAAKRTGSDVDLLVSDFLDQLSGLSAEIKETTPGQPPAPVSAEVAPAAVGQASKAAAAVHLVTVPDPPANPFEDSVAPAAPEPEAEAAAPEPELDPDAINREIEATLAELERHKPVVIPMPPPKAAPAPAAAPHSGGSKSTTSPSRPAGGKPPAAVGATEAQEWTRLDIFRSEVANARSARRRRIVLIVIAAAVLLAIFLYIVIAQLDNVPGLLGRFHSDAPEPQTLTEMQRRDFAPVPAAGAAARECFRNSQQVG